MGNLRNLRSIKLRYGLDGALYAVFPTCYEAEEAAWLFSSILCRRPACFGQYYNAYRLFG